MNGSYVATPIGRGILDGDWRGEWQYHLLSSAIMCLFIKITSFSGCQDTYVRDMKVKGACLVRNLAFCQEL